MNWTVRFLFVMFVSFISGCAANIPRPVALGMPPAEAEGVVSMPAPKLLNLIRREAATNHLIEIARSGDGFIETTWKSCEGSEHGLWFWKRKWPAESMYELSIQPSFSHPATEAYIKINSVSHERPNANYEWAPVHLDDARSKSVALLNLIQTIAQWENKK